MERKQSLRVPNGGAAEFPWLPGYIIKLSVEARIAGAEKLQSCIREKRLDLLLLPKQTRFEIPKRYHGMTVLRSLCIAEKIEGYIGVERSINLGQAKRLVTLILETGFADPKFANLVHCDNGKIAIIDTESLGNIFLSIMRPKLPLGGKRLKYEICHSSSRRLRYGCCFIYGARKNKPN